MSLVIAAAAVPALAFGLAAARQPALARKAEADTLAVGLLVEGADAPAVDRP